MISSNAECWLIHISDTADLSCVKNKSLNYRMSIILGSIRTSDLHIKLGSVPCAMPTITIGHEMVGVVGSVDSKVRSIKPDRIVVNVETF